MTLAVGSEVGATQEATGVSASASLPAFDVASVRLNKSGEGRETSNVPLGPGNVYAATGGALTARGFPR
jgi:hypothetical protein